VYRYLQITLHKYRVLLLLPFLLSHCFFYLSLHYPADGSSSSLKNAPDYYLLHNPAVETLHVVKGRQLSKSFAALLAVLPEKVIPEAPAPVVVGHTPVRPATVTSYHPPALFPSRASPV
jgi:hypothetical protein